MLQELVIWTLPEELLQRKIILSKFFYFFYFSDTFMAVEVGIGFVPNSQSYDLRFSCIIFAFPSIYFRESLFSLFVELI